MQCPPLSVAKHRNYKGTFGLILMALVDGYYNFMYVHVGTPGRASDGGALAPSLASSFAACNTVCLDARVKMHAFGA